MIPATQVQDDSVRLLLLESERGAASEVAELLDSEGRPRFEVARATMEEGLDDEDRYSFEVVLLDLGVADTASLERVGQVRKRWPGCPLVALSLLDDDEMGLAILRRGADDLLRRDQLDRGRLVRRCRYAIERRLVLSQLEVEHERERLERELEALEHGSALRQLREKQPDALSTRDASAFDDLVTRYTSVAETAVDRSIREANPVPGEALQALAERIRRVDAGPLDLLDIHLASMRTYLAQAEAPTPVAHADISSLLALGVMSVLTSSYREEAMSKASEPEKP